MGRTRIGFRLSEEKKSRWREHVEEESRYDDTLSDLIKRSVENQIDRDVGDATPSKAVEPQGQSPGEVLDRIQDLRNDIQDLKGEVSESLDALHAQEGLDPDLPPEVHAGLPVGEENARTAEEVAEAINYAVSPEQARFALENMVRNLGDVKKTPEGMPGANPDTEIRWYRIE